MLEGLCSSCGGVGRAGYSYSLMDSTKREKMPTTCHRRMSQNTTVSFVSGGGLGLGGAVLGCGVKRKRSEPGTGQQAGMGSARTQPTRFRIPKMFQTFTANTLDLKKSKV